MKTLTQYPYSICRQRGFTLIQTMVALGLLGLALALIAKYLI
jgi:type II secretory pathway pseudopilin PulG